MSSPDIAIGSPLDPPPTNGADIPVAVGDVLAGKYRVDHILGVGGMGVVVAATHLMLHQRVALKFMLQSSMQDEDLGERFLREARAMARLRGEHVARVLDVGLLGDGAPYMVMEYLEGRDLRSILCSGPGLPVAEAIDYIVQACEAVAEAHARGVVHRDLKPHNLFVANEPDGRRCVKVLDFGISKIISDPALTRATALLGSPHYMAPEQLRSPGYVDGRADIWALGVCLYQLLTKRTPYEANGFLEFTDKLLYELPVSPEVYRQDLPGPLVEVIMRCLEKAPVRRFATATDLARALLAVQASSPRLRGQSLARTPSSSSFSVSRSAPSTIAPVALHGSRHTGAPSPPTTGPSRGLRGAMVVLAASLFAAGVAVGVVGNRAGVAVRETEASGSEAESPVEPTSELLLRAASQTAAVIVGPEPKPPATGIPVDDAGPPALMTDAARPLPSTGFRSAP